MGSRDILHNSVSFIGKVYLRDSTTGLGKTGVTAASMSGNYVKDNNSAATSLSFAAGSVGDAYSSGKWAEIGNGYYFYHYPNAAWNTLGETGFSFRSSGAIDAAPKFRVVAYNSESATSLGLSNLDAAVSSRSSHSAAAAATAVRSELSTELARIDENVSAAKTLTSGERSTLAGVIDLAIINQGDGADLIKAIANAIADDWVVGDASPLAIIAALKADAEWISLIADAAAAKVAAQSAKSVTDKLDTSLEPDGASGYQFTTLALENAPAGGGGGDATAANQTTIINHLADIKGATWSSSTDSLEAIRDRGDAAWVGGTVVIDADDIQSIVDGVIAGIGTGDVVASSQSVASSTDISLIQGDDYLAADGRSLVWIATAADFWPDLTGATLAFTATMGGTTIEALPVVVSPTGTQSVRLDLTSTDTDVASGEYTYDIQATLASGSIVTLVRGTLYIELDVTP